jgi:deoxyribodipyrimidine photo-lyase
MRRVNLRTDLETREDVTAHLAATLEGLYSTPPVPAELEGSREAAFEALQAFSTRGYGARNHVDAPVSRLSAYLRHGVLSITEVADHVRSNARGRERDEFLKQLAWREFFMLVLEQEGTRVFDNLEPPKYPARWTPDLPIDVREARTGLPCVDAWVTRLVTTGYMHNHERLWFAAYLTHWRRVHWRAGYQFFREHLLDGDIASNALSWQWVASTFSSKPYFMNQENIARYSADRWCARCRVACPFRKNYATLEAELFGGSRFGA